MINISFNKKSKQGLVALPCHTIHTSTTEFGKLLKANLLYVPLKWCEIAKKDRVCVCKCDKFFLVIYRYRSNKNSKLLLKFIHNSVWRVADDVCLLLLLLWFCTGHSWRCYRFSPFMYVQLVFLAVVCLVSGSSWCCCCSQTHRFFLLSIHIILIFKIKERLHGDTIVYILLANKKILAVVRNLINLTVFGQVEAVITFRKLFVIFLFKNQILFNFHYLEGKMSRI